MQDYYTCGASTSQRLSSAAEDVSPQCYLLQLGMLRTHSRLTVSATAPNNTGIHICACAPPLHGRAGTLDHVH